MTVSSLLMVTPAPGRSPPPTETSSNCSLVKTSDAETATTKSPRLYMPPSWAEAALPHMRARPRTQQDVGNFTLNGFISSLPDTVILSGPGPASLISPGTAGVFLRPSGLRQHLRPTYRPCPKSCRRRSLQSSWSAHWYYRPRGWA